MSKLSAILRLLVGRRVWIVWRNETFGSYMVISCDEECIEVETICDSQRHRYTAPINEVVFAFEDKSPMDFPVYFLDMSHRAKNLMGRLRIETVSEMANLSTRALLDRPNIGVGTIESINQALRSYGLSLRP